MIPRQVQPTLAESPWNHPVKGNQKAKPRLSEYRKAGRWSVCVDRSVAVKVRFALFKKGAHALFLIGSAEQAMEQAPLPRDTFAKRQFLGPHHRLARQPGRWTGITEIGRASCRESGEMAVGDG